MLDITLGQSPVTVGEMIVILALLWLVLYFFTNITVRTISVIFWWVLCLAVFIGIPVGLGVWFVMWVLPIPQ